jgi:hypothetical protein
MTNYFKKYLKYKKKYFELKKKKLIGGVIFTYEYYMRKKYIVYKKIVLLKEN